MPYKNFNAALAALSAAQFPEDSAIVRAEATRRTLQDCDGRPAKYRSALEAGADPTVVAGWIKEVEADRLAAKRELASTGIAQPLTEAEIRALVASQRKILRTLARATPEQRAVIYGQTMGLSVHGHEKVRPYGHERSALMATKSPQFWPPKVRTPH